LVEVNEVVTRQLQNASPAYLPMTSVTAQTNGQVLSWFQCWQVVCSFLSALHEL